MAVVETTSGHLRGRRSGDHWLFAGVPYAAPPTGERRLRAPSPHAGWSGVRDATRFGAVPVQPPFSRGNRKETIDEDCLFLNVETPALDDARRPTFVWFHGGAFVNGGGSFGEYRGTELVRNGDLVFVSINYRLGALGWLPLRHRFEDLPDSGNLGLLDQIAALRWIGDNIAAFGGDPGNITVCGQSAGAMSLGVLLGTTEASHLVRRAILQSGTGEHVLSAEQAERTADLVLDELGARTVDDVLGADAEHVLAAQQAVLGRLSDRIRRPGISSPIVFGPVVDGRLVRDPSSAHELSYAADVPVIVGSNLDECDGFVLSGAPTLTEIRRHLEGRVPDPDALLGHYREHNSSTKDVWSAVCSDQLFRLPAIRCAEQWTRRGTRAWRYLFSWRPPGAATGASHSREVPYVFGTVDALPGRMLAGPEPPHELEHAMHRSWIAFARTGDPNHPDLPGWAPYGERRTTLVFERPCRLETDPDAAVRRLWDDD